MRLFFILSTVLLVTVTVLASAIVNKGEPILKVNEMVLAKRIENRQPLDIQEDFTVQDGRVIAFINLVSCGHDNITFIWKRDGQEYFKYTAPVQDSPHWRTYSSVKALAGNWEVGVYDANNQLIKEITFTITQNIEKQHHDVEETVKETISLKPKTPKKEKNKTTVEKTSVTEALKSMENKDKM